MKEINFTSKISSSGSQDSDEIFFVVMTGFG